MIPADLPSPFHHGESHVQNLLGVRSDVMSYAPKVVRPFMPDQHRQFYESQPFLVVAARDESGRIWSTLLTGHRGEKNFVESPSPTHLSINAALPTRDALYGKLIPGTDLGILGIEFATKRRNRVNGRIRAVLNSTIEFQVDQSFGNCPQYIKPRNWLTIDADINKEQGPAEPQDDIFSSTSLATDNELSKKQMDIIRGSDTIFVASGYRGGSEEDPRYGNDASHRGGPSGWIGVVESKTLVLPDFSGNNHFNTIGNLMLDNRMGITVPLFETGGMIQLTGTAEVNFDEKKAASTYPGAKRLIIFSIEKVVQLPDGSLPILFTPVGTSDRRMLQITKKVRETEDVTSFYLQAPQGQDPELGPFRPGQHLPISLKLDETSGQSLERSYSLSGGQNWGEYRISVKRHPFGVASNHLHALKVGSKFLVHRPAGDFVVHENSKNKNRTLVLVSMGIGATPVLSMLYSFAHLLQLQKGITHNEAIWVQGVRDGRHHPFRHEVQELVQMSHGKLRAHVSYSKPQPEDTGYNSVGRIDGKLLKVIVPDFLHADFYLCGSDAFTADIQRSLESYGVKSKHIRSESF